MIAFTTMYYECIDRQKLTEEKKTVEHMVPSPNKAGRNKNIFIYRVAGKGEEIKALHNKLQFGINYWPKTFHKQRLNYSYSNLLLLNHGKSCRLNFNKMIFIKYPDYRKNLFCSSFLSR